MNSAWIIVQGLFYYLVYFRIGLVKGYWMRRDKYEIVRSCWWKEPTCQQAPTPSLLYSIHYRTYRSICIFDTDCNMLSGWERSDVADLWPYLVSSLDETVVAFREYIDARKRITRYLEGDDVKDAISQCWKFTKKGVRVSWETELLSLLDKRLVSERSCSRSSGPKVTDVVYLL